MFEKYDFYLCGIREFDDYWSDFGIFDAVKVLEEFSYFDWQILEELVLDRSKIWIISCAETLSEITNVEKAYGILSKILTSDDFSISFSAIDSINSLIGSGFVNYDYIKISGILLEMKIKTGCLKIVVIDLLAERIKNFSE